MTDTTQRASRERSSDESAMSLNLDEVKGEHGVAQAQCLVVVIQI